MSKTKSSADASRRLKPLAICISRDHSSMFSGDGQHNQSGMHIEVWGNAMGSVCVGGGEQVEGAGNVNTKSSGTPPLVTAATPNRFVPGQG
jgi:hypothetical protein